MDDTRALYAAVQAARVRVANCRAALSVRPDDYPPDTRESVPANPPERISMTEVKPAPPAAAGAREDGTLALLVALFAAVHHIESDRVWTLLEVSYSAGKLAGFDLAKATIDRARAEAEGA